MAQIPPQPARNAKKPPKTVDERGCYPTRQTKDERVIAALIANPTIRAAATASGISETQIYARLRTPEFKNKYAEARRQLLERNTAALQGHLAAAIETLAKVCQDEKAAPQVRINAADAIIRNTLKMTEQSDILTRLGELEQQIGGRKVPDYE